MANTNSLPPVQCHCGRSTPVALRCVHCSRCLVCNTTGSHGPGSYWEDKCAELFATEVRRFEAACEKATVAA